MLNRVFAFTMQGEQSRDPGQDSPFAFFEADNVQLSGSTVTNWPCKVSPGTNDLATIASDPAIVATDAAAGNRPTVHFGSTKGLQNPTASLWKFLHDESDWLAWMVVRLPLAEASAQLFDTNTGTGGQHGFGLYCNGVLNWIEGIYTNGTTTLFRGYHSRRDSVPTTTMQVVLRHRQGKGLQISVNGMVVVSDAPLTTYSSSNPHHGLLIATGTERWIAELGFIKAAKTDEEARAYENFLATKYDIDLARPAGPYLQLFWTGNSIIESTDLNAFPDNVLTLLDNKNVSERYLGLSGQKTQECADRDDQRIGNFVDARAARKMAFLCESINSYSTGQTRAQILASAQAWAVEIQAAGVEAWITTVQASDFFDNPTDRAWLNAAYEAGVGVWCDGVVPFHDNPQLGPDDAQDDTNYFADGVHFAVRGKAIAAGVMAETINATWIGTPAALSLDDISPATSPDTGGATLDATGFGFDRDGVLDIDGTPVDNPVFLNSQWVSGDAPAHAVEADLEVTFTRDDAGTDTLVDAFEYTSSSPPTPLDIFGANCVGLLGENYTAATGVWVDESATAVNTSQANSGLRPAAGTLNGHVCADFNGNHCLNWGGNRNPISGDFTIWGAFKSNQIDGPGVLMGKLYSSIAWWFGGSNVTANHVSLDLVNASSASEAISNADLEDNAIHYFIARRNGTLHELWIDGALQTDTGTYTGAIPSISEFLAVGGSMSTNEATTQWRWHGLIATPGMANVSATSGQIDDLNAFLANFCFG